MTSTTRCGRATFTSMGVLTALLLALGSPFASSAGASGSPAAAAGFVSTRHTMAARVTGRGAQGEPVHLMLPPRASVRGMVPATPPPGSHLSFNGGAVVRALKAYAIYWQPSGYHFEEAYRSGSGPDTQDARYERLIDRFFADAGSTKYFNILTQYSDTSGQVQNTMGFGGQWVDTKPLNQFAASSQGTIAHPLFDSDIQAEVQRAILQNPKWPESGMGAEFFVFTPGGVHSCTDSRMVECDAEYTKATAPALLSPYCAYHGSFDWANRPVLYSNMFDAGFSTACGGPNWTDQGKLLGPYDGNGPNGDPVADYEISPTSHEMAETITDPIPSTGWADASDGYEVGDICAYIFGPLTNGGDIALHGHSYLIQQEWDNSGGDCASAYQRPATLSVNSTADSVPAAGTTPLCANTPGGDNGSNTAYLLRCALGDANNDALAGVATHAIRFTGCPAPCAINLTSALPTLSAPGLTVAGGGSTSLSGNHAVSTGLAIRASKTTVSGLTVKNFTGDGIDVGYASTHVTVGGAQPDVILNNGGFGILIGSSTKDGSSAVVRSSPVYGNAKGGISLNGLAPAHCSTGARSGAPNGYIACPSITAARSKVITGRSSCAICTVEVFVVPSTPDRTGHGQGRSVVGSATTNSAGAWSVKSAAALGAGTLVTATVTNSKLGATSEFAANHKVS